jgi:ribosomal protein S18 acetylase RimI-like enzyme
MQVGLVRVITDLATFAYLCDVYVLESHRKRGLAQAALRSLQHHPRLQKLRRWQLVTLDAQSLYAKVGFEPTRHPERYMEKLDREVYRRSLIKAAGAAPQP